MGPFLFFQTSRKMRLLKTKDAPQWQDHSFLFKYA
jgi:hypothetical protein